MSTDYKKIISEEFEKTYETAAKMAREISSPANLYLLVDGQKFKIPIPLDAVKPVSKCWNKDSMSIDGCLVSYYTNNKKLCFNTKPMRIHLLNIDPETTKFVIESQGYLREKKTKILPKKLRLALKEVNTFQSASVKTEKDSMNDAA